MESHPRASSHHPTLLTQHCSHPNMSSLCHFWIYLLIQPIALAALILKARPWVNADQQNVNLSPRDPPKSLALGSLSATIATLFHTLLETGPLFSRYYALSCSLQELEEGRTYDDLWNAAQMEMVRYGKVSQFNPKLFKLFCIFYIIRFTFCMTGTWSYRCTPSCACTGVRKQPSGPLHQKMRSRTCYI